MGMGMHSLSLDGLMISKISISQFHKYYLFIGEGEKGLEIVISISNPNIRPFISV